VQVVDDRYVIRNVNARFAGATHDGHVWKHSDARKWLHAHYNSNTVCVLLGDSGYPLEPWLMIPYEEECTPDEQRFNVRHRVARCGVERTFGVLKGRWRCLSKQRVLYYHSEKAAHIVQACCVLHNICIERNIDFDGNINDSPGNDGNSNDSNNNTAGSALTTRDNIRKQGEKVRDYLAKKLR
jgi:nuclease HARBI1